LRNIIDALIITLSFECEVIASPIPYTFIDLLTGPEMLLKFEELVAEGHREHQFPPTQTLSMFLGQAMNENYS